MALQVWLPLNGSAINQGLSGANITGSPASWGNGNMGKCATFTGGQIIKSDTTHDFDYTGDLSWACWVNTNYKTPTGTGWYTEYAFSVGRVDNTSFGYGLQVSSTSKCYAWYGSKAYAISVTGGKWIHIAFVKSGTNISIYINGSRETNSTFSGTAPTFADSVGLGVGCFHYSGGDLYKYNGSLCDFRLYNNALSPKEVHEIAQGLCCHYPLNDPFSTSSINKYSGNTFEGKPSASDYTVTKLVDERGYNFTLSQTGTGGNYQPNIQYPYFSFTPGKTYDYSCKVRCHSSNFNINFRASHINNDQVTTMKSVTSNADGKWHEYHIRLTLQSKYTRAGTEYDTNPMIEFYSETLATKDKAYSCNFDIKDVQVSECETDASVSDLSQNDGFIYDTSGFGNHGTVPALYRPAFAGDSPRYDKCYSFDGNNRYFTIPNPIMATTPAFTISCWVNCSYTTTQTLYTARTAVGYGVALFIFNGSPRLDDNTQTYFGYDMTAYNNKWTHICVTRSATAKKLYVNGVLVSTQTGTVGDMKNIGVNGTIGGSESKDDGIATGNWLNGKLSDFRIYSTALSDADVLALYNAPISVASNGTLIMKGEVIENL